MREGLTEVVMLLDRSGSMSGLENDTIGGFNSMLARQKMQPGEAYLSVILFDNRSEVLYDRVDIREASPMTAEQYYVRGCTALLDAVGGAIRHVQTIHRYAREEDRPEKTLFIITTDGMENASRQYSLAQVHRMISDAREKDHWEFIFLGANIDAVEVAGRFGVRPDRAVRYEHDAEGTRRNYEAMDKAVSYARCAASPAMMSRAFDEEDVLGGVREDYRKRHGGRDRLPKRTRRDPVSEE